MKYDIYPPVQVIRDEIFSRKLTVGKISALTNLSMGRLRNILTGRTDMTIRERDIICQSLGIYPGDVVLQREDLTDNKGFIDVRHFPEPLREAIRTLINALHDPKPPRRKRKKVTAS
ncbi:hypothetical protein [Erwinia typographi]|nr:hypothetical protein [Erwinia typographi]